MENVGLDGGGSIFFPTPFVGALCRDVTDPSGEEGDAGSEPPSGAVFSVAGGLLTGAVARFCAVVELVAALVLLPLVGIPTWPDAPGNLVDPARFKPDSNFGGEVVDVLGFADPSLSREVVRECDGAVLLVNPMVGVRT